MIHYHGAPVGCPADAAARFWAGRHAFVSFAEISQLAVIADACQSFALDNGAFSAWRSGREFDRDGYLEFVETWHRHPGCDWHVIPDVIDGTEMQNNWLIESWPFKRGVPVWHMHESMSRLRWLVRDFHTVALGSSGQWPSPGAHGWWVRMAEAMKVACDEDGRPRCKLHGLRMLNPDVFRHLPLASADSTNAARSAGNLKWDLYAPRHVWQRANVVADRVEAHNSAHFWEDAGVQECFGF